MRGALYLAAPSWPINALTDPTNFANLATTDECRLIVYRDKTSSGEPANVQQLLKFDPAHPFIDSFRNLDYLSKYDILHDENIQLGYQNMEFVAFENPQGKAVDLFQAYPMSQSEPLNINVKCNIPVHYYDAPSGGTAEHNWIQSNNIHMVLIPRWDADRIRGFIRSRVKFTMPFL